MLNVTRNFTSKGKSVLLTVDIEGASKEQIAEHAMNYWVWNAQRTFRDAESDTRETYVKEGMNVKWDATGQKVLSNDDLIAALVSKGMTKDQATAVVLDIKPQVESKLVKKAA